MIENVGFVIKRLAHALFRRSTFQTQKNIFLELTRECFDPNKQTQNSKAQFCSQHLLTISAVTHSCSLVFFFPSWKQKHVPDLEFASEDTIVMSQLEAGGELQYLTFCYCSAIS